MKIVFIPLTFLPRSNGGGAVAMYNAAKGLQNRGHSVSVLTAENWESEPSANQAVCAVEDSWDGLPVRRLSYDSKKTGYPPPWFDTLNPTIEQQVTDYLRQENPDVVHVTCGQHLSASPIVAAVKLGIPVVLTLIGFWYICPLTTLLKPDYSLCNGRKYGYECLECLAPNSRLASTFSSMRPNVRAWVSGINSATELFARRNDALRIVRAVDHRNRTFASIFQQISKVLAPSNALRDIFIQSGMVEPDQIIYWQYCVNVKHVEAGRQKRPSTKLRLGYTGHMYRQKGVDVLIKAVLNLPKDLPVQLKLYGSLTEKDAVYGRELQELVGQDERIQFLGRYENDQLGEILSEIDAVVVPSLWMENSPVAIHEALAAHTPVIATNLGGMADLIQHEHNGLLFRRGDERDLSEQIRKVAIDPALLTRLGNNTHTVRGIDDEAAALQTLYESIRRR